MFWNEHISINDKGFPPNKWKNKAFLKKSQDSINSINHLLKKKEKWKYMCIKDLCKDKVV